MHATKRSSIALLALLSVACAGGAAAPGTAAGPGRWELLPASDHPLPRHETGYVRVGDRFYLVGGRGTKPVKPVEIFDPATGAWTMGATPPLEIHHFQAVEYDGKVYVVCGMTGGYPHETPLANVYVYDPAADRWSVGPEIPRDRRRGSAGTVVHDGRIYLVAGIQDGHWDGHVAWFDAFDPRTGGWQRLPDAPHARDHFHAAVIDGRLYAAGGRRSSARIGKVVELTVPEVDVYDFRAGRWSTLPASSNIPTQRAGTFSAVLGGRLLVMGGESAAQQPAHSEVEALDPRTGRWTALAPLVVGRQATQAVAYRGRLYVVAGSRTRGATEVNSQETYRPER
jgi:N-acetylneuraminic acid mutarotase